MAQGNTVEDFIKENDSKRGILSSIIYDVLKYDKNTEIDDKLLQQLFEYGTFLTNCVKNSGSMLCLFLFSFFYLFFCLYHLLKLLIMTY